MATIRYNDSARMPSDGCYIERSDRTNRAAVRYDLTNFSTPRRQVVEPVERGMSTVNGYGPNPKNISDSTQLREGTGGTQFRPKDTYRGRVAGGFQGRGRPPVNVESNLVLGSEPTKPLKSANTTLHYDGTCRIVDFAPSLGRWNPQQVRYVVAPVSEMGGWEHNGSDTRMDGRQLVGKGGHCLSWMSGTGGRHKYDAVQYLNAARGEGCETRPERVGRALV